MLRFSSTESELQLRRRNAEVYCVPVSSMNLLVRMLNVLKWSVREMCTTRVCGCVILTKARGVV